MKQITSISLLLVLLGTLTYNVYQLGVFVAHQEEITELFCVNKDKPQLKCNGKCHLSKKLVQTSTEDNAEKGAIPAPSLPLFVVFLPEEQHEINLFVLEKEMNCDCFRNTLNQYLDLDTPPPEYTA